MSPPEKAKPQPLTPPLSDRLEQQYLVPSNSASPYQPSPYEFEDIPHLPSHSHTTFSSPEPRQIHIDPYGHGPYRTAYHGQEIQPNTFHGPPNVGLDVQFDQYAPQGYYPVERGPYTVQSGPYTYPVPPQIQYPNPPYLDSSPPTPAASNQSSSKKRTKKTTRASTPSTRSAKAKKKGEKDEGSSGKTSKVTKHATDKSKIPKLTAPLSELTKDFEHVPVKDMNAWTTRPKEKRVTELGKGGRIPRPMNSFMLYRSAYAERCKIWCTQNNHQVVSTVCGESWALEPPEIKQLYADYAQVERENHAKAHPDYRFSPTKAGTTGRKRKRTTPDDEDEEEPSDLDDPDFEYRPSAVKEGKKRAKTPGPVSTFPTRIAPQVNYLNGENGRERSTFQYNNPGKAPPLPLGAHELQGQYYQSMVVQNPRAQHNVEDVLVRRMDAPTMQYGPAPPVVALPGASHYELLDGQAIGNSNLQTTEAPLDPLLSQFNGDFNDSSTDFQNFDDFGQAGLSYESGPQSTAPPPEAYPATTEAYATDLDSWQFQPTETDNSGDLGDFEAWMKQNNNR